MEPKEKHELDNRSNQLNPNNDAYRSSRANDDDDDDDLDHKKDEGEPFTYDAEDDDYGMEGGFTDEWD